MIRRRHAWGLLAGVCVVFAACGPEEIPGGVASAGEDGSSEDARFKSIGDDVHDRCTPPRFVADLTLGASGSDIRAFIEFKGMILISGHTTPEGSGLWKLVQRRDPSTGALTWEALQLQGFVSDPLDFVEAGGTLFFTANDGTHGMELWKTDGTPEGTRMVEDIQPGDAGAGPFNLIAVGKTLYFGADDGVHGAELWKSDGSHEGTQLVEDIQPGPAGSSPSGMMALGRHQLFFVADDGVHGREPWVSDGSHRGTQLIEDIRQGAESSFPSFLVRLSHMELFFLAEDGVHGVEPWTSDGTHEGTRLIVDIRPGPEGSTPGIPVSVHGMMACMASIRG